MKCSSKEKSGLDVVVVYVSRADERRVEAEVVGRKWQLTIKTIATENSDDEGRNVSKKECSDEDRMYLRPVMMN